MRPVVGLRDPRTLPAAAVGALGLVDITLGVVAPRSAPTIFWPHAALGATGTTMTCGLALLLLARGLSRGLRAAWVLAIALLVLAALAAPVAHDDWALLALVPAAVLCLHWRNFSAPARAPRRGYAALLGGLALLAVAPMALHGAPAGHRRGVALAHLAHAAAVNERVRAVRALPAPGHGGPALFPLAGAAALMLLLGLRSLTLPGLPRRGAANGAARDLAQRLFDVYGANGVGYVAAYGATAAEIDLWTDPWDRGVVAFRVVGTTALVVGDPLALPAALPAVLDGFLAHCRAHGWTPAFYQTVAETLPHYRARGLRAMAIGCEALIDLRGFTLSGKQMANVRHSVTHAERAGLRVQLSGTDELDDTTRADLRALSDEWLAAKGGGELGFTVGRLGPDGGPSPGARVAVAYGPAGRAQAFITLVPAGGGRGWMLDLMRRRRAAESGTMDLLIARTAEALREEGYALLSLSLAPLASGEDAAEDAPRPARLGRELLYEKMEGVYSYRSLFSYKRKFGVRWETRYLVYAGDAALPAALYAVVRAHLPSPRSVLERLPLGRVRRWLSTRAQAA